MRVCFTLVVMVLARFYINATEIRCTRPALVLYTMGYIQCQRACIRRTDCYVLRYNKEQLACSIYLDKHCTSGVGGKYIYQLRNGISQFFIRIQRNEDLCDLDTCSPGYICTILRNGSQICVQDKILTYGRTLPASFLQLDGNFFIFIEAWAIRSAAASFCSNSFSGHLAVSNTIKKLRALAGVMLDIPTTQYWWIGGHYEQNVVTWYPDTYADVNCVGLNLYGQFFHIECSLAYYFVCEM
ncbi:uncharacterized protein [Argopecten irradians]|uniref:uncharacterized protein n=1 Tax=Argopecten irradians TaxID=31199 RepID=UPI00371CDE0B